MSTIPASRAAWPRVLSTTQALNAGEAKEAIEAFPAVLQEIAGRHGNTKLSTLSSDLSFLATKIECAFLEFYNGGNQQIINTEAKLAAKENENLELKKEIDRLKVLKFDQILQNFQLTNATGVTATKPGMSTAFRSYAQAAKPTESGIPPVKTNHVVILEPKKGADIANSDQTFKLFKLTVEPKILHQDKIAIKSKKFTSKSRVVLTCGSKQQCDALCKAMASNQVIQASVPKKKNPQVQILGIDEQISKEEVFGMIISQNGLDDLAECKFEPKFEKIDRLGTKFVVAEVEPKLYQKLVALKKVCLGYSLCPVKDRIRVMRCYKCNRYGHCQRECRNETACAACAGPHDTKNCTGGGVQCCNCKWVNEKRIQRKQEPIDANHRADDPNCAQYQRMRHIVENQFDFG